MSEENARQDKDPKRLIFTKKGALFGVVAYALLAVLIVMVFLHH